METTNTLITQIKKMALPGEVQQITGTSLLVKNLFVLVQSERLPNRSDPPMQKRRHDPQLQVCNTRR